MVKSWNALGASVTGIIAAVSPADVPDDDQKMPSTFRLHVPTLVTVNTASSSAIKSTSMRNSHVQLDPLDGVELLPDPPVCLLPLPLPDPLRYELDPLEDDFELPYAPSAMVLFRYAEFCQLLDDLLALHARIQSAFVVNEVVKRCVSIANVQESTTHPFQHYLNALLFAGSSHR
jgi:hypothetical protein